MGKDVSSLPRKIDRFVQDTETYVEALRCARDAYTAGPAEIARLRRMQLAGHWKGASDDRMCENALIWATTVMGGQILLIRAAALPLAEELRSSGFSDTARSVLKVRDYANYPDDNGTKLLASWPEIQALLQDTAIRLRLKLMAGSHGAVTPSPQIVADGEARHKVATDLTAEVLDSLIAHYEWFSGHPPLPEPDETSPHWQGCITEAKREITEALKTRGRQIALRLGPRLPRKRKATSRNHLTFDEAVERKAHQLYVARVPEYKKSLEEAVAAFAERVKVLDIVLAPVRTEIRVLSELSTADQWVYEPVARFQEMPDGISICEWPLPGKVNETKRVWQHWGAMAVHDLRRIRAKIEQGVAPREDHAGANSVSRVGATQGDAETVAMPDGEEQQVSKYPRVRALTIARLIEADRRDACELKRKWDKRKNFYPTPCGKAQSHKKANVYDAKQLLERAQRWDSIEEEDMPELLGEAMCLKDDLST